MTNSIEIHLSLTENTHGIYTQYNVLKHFYQLCTLANWQSSSVYDILHDSHVVV